MIMANPSRQSLPENDPKGLSSEKRREEKAKKKKSNSPLKSAKHGRGLRRPANPALADQQGADEDGDGDEAREPEEHGDGIEGQHGELVGEAGEVAGHEGEVGRHEEGPDGGEDEEVDGGGGGVDGEVVVVVRHCFLGGCVC